MARGYRGCGSRGRGQVTDYLWPERPPPRFLHQPQHFAPRARSQSDVLRHPTRNVLLVMGQGDLVIELSGSGTFTTDHN